MLSDPSVWPRDPFPWCVCAGKATRESLVPTLTALTCFLTETGAGFMEEPGPEGPGPEHGSPGAASGRIPLHGESGPAPRLSACSGACFPGLAMAHCDLSEP